MYMILYVAIHKHVGSIPKKDLPIHILLVEFGRNLQVNKLTQLITAFGFLIYLFTIFFTVIYFSSQGFGQTKLE